MIKNRIIWLASAFALAGFSIFAAPAKISINVGQPGHKIAPTLWGIFFEDINLSADGGIYPELVQNRSFEDADTPENWKFTSLNGRSLATISTPDYTGKTVNPPLNPLNRKSLRIQADGEFALENEGYWGMNLVKGDGYTLKFAARATDWFNVPVNAKIISSTGKEIAAGELNNFGDKLTDENSLAQPEKVSPVTETWNFSSPNFKHTFPGNSFTVLRLQTK